MSDLSSGSNDSASVSDTGSETGSNPKKKNKKKKKEGQSSGHKHQKRKDKDKNNVDLDILRKQIHKWGQHHNIPAWAEEKLRIHLAREKERKKEMKRNRELTCCNLMKAWRWCKIWHQRHMHKGDIGFPEETDDEMTMHEDDGDTSTLSTESLVDEILDDEKSNGPNKAGVEKNGLQNVDVWTPTRELMKRDKLFSKKMMTENTKRSVALGQPKDSDEIPGSTELNSDEKLSYKTEMLNTQYCMKTNRTFSTKMEKIKTHAH